MKPEGASSNPARANEIFVGGSSVRMKTNYVSYINNRLTVHYFNINAYLHISHQLHNAIHIIPFPALMNQLAALCLAA